MSTTYPSVKQTFTDPAGTSRVDTLDHAQLHTDHNDTVEAIQDTVGTTAGTNLAMHFSAGQFPLRVTGGGATGTHVTTLVGGTLDHTTLIGTPQITGGTVANGVVNNPTVGTPAVTGGTLTNPVITTGTVNNPTVGTPTLVLGGDTAGDIFFRSAGGTLNRLASGALDYFLKSGGVGTAPSWGSVATSSGTYKVGGFTRLLDANSGAAAFTGVGFTPKAMVFFAVNDQTPQVSWGFSSGAAADRAIARFAANYTFYTDKSIAVDNGTTTGQTGSITGFNSDGGTIGWTKNGTPSAGTIQVLYLAIG